MRPKDIKFEIAIPIRHVAESPPIIHYVARNDFVFAYETRTKAEVQRIVALGAYGRFLADLGTLLGLNLLARDCQHQGVPLPSQKERDVFGRACGKRAKASLTPWVPSASAQSLPGQ